MEQYITLMFCHKIWGRSGGQRWEKRPREGLKCCIQPLGSVLGGWGTTQPFREGGDGGRSPEPVQFWEEPDLAVPRQGEGRIRGFLVSPHWHRCPENLGPFLFGLWRWDEEIPVLSALKLFVPGSKKPRPWLWPGFAIVFKANPICSVQNWGSYWSFRAQASSSWDTHSLGNLHLPYLLIRPQQGFGWGCTARYWKRKSNLWLVRTFLPVGKAQPGFCLSHPREQLNSPHHIHRVAQPSFLITAPRTQHRQHLTQEVTKHPIRQD